MTDPKEIIGEAVLRDLADHGYEVVKKAAPEPVRLVTMEESGERWDRTTDLTWTSLTGNRWLIENAADDWLVKVVLRRLLDELNTKSNVWGVRALRHEWGLDK